MANTLVPLDRGTDWIVDNTAPTASDIQTANVSGGTNGLAETGDSITFTFSEPIDPNSVIAGWDGWLDDGNPAAD